MARRKTPKATASDPSSPRKSARKVAPPNNQTTSPKKRKVNGPLHCGRCEGRPLRSQCEHTKRGKEYLLRQEAFKTLSDAIQPDAQDEAPSAPDPSPDSSHESVATLSPVRTDQAIPPWVGVNIHMDMIDPALLAISSPAHTDPPGASDFEATTSEPTVSLEQSNTPTSSFGPSLTPASTPTVKRIRATASNPIFRYVEGVCRGPNPHNVHRKHALPEPITESTRASRTFLEKMNSLVEMCEDISIKTGAWLFVGAQHPSASGGAIHYSSPRLRRDGGQKTLDFATSFLKLAKRVREAKRLDTYEFQKMIEEQREKNERIQKELDAARAQAAADNQELAQFRLRFGSLGCDT